MMNGGASQNPAIGCWRERLQYAPAARPTRLRGLRALNRVFAVLCFALIFVTATEPAAPVSMETIAAALEALSLPQAFPNTAWR